MTLVKTWINHELKENKVTLTEATRELNNKTKQKYTISRVREWASDTNARGNQLPVLVREHMLRKVIARVVRGVDFDNISKYRLNSIVNKLK